MKKQVVIIHGGDSFDTYESYLDFLKEFKIDFERWKEAKEDWKPWIRKQLSDEYDVFLPQMPNKTDARYEEWRIWFEKFIPYLNDGVILIGHSLGGSFLAKYLSENKFPKRIGAVMLVAAVFDKDSWGNGLLSFTLPGKIDLQSENVFFYHSVDDLVVPFSALGHFKEAIPAAQTRIFKDRKHINMEEFPELLEDIKSLN